MFHICIFLGICYLNNDLSNPYQLPPTPPQISLTLCTLYIRLLLLYYYDGIQQSCILLL